MKMVMICYNEAVHGDVMDVLNDCGLKNYTLVSSVFGKGTNSGVHLGDDIWPGRNNILYVACEEQDAKQLLLYVSNLRKKLAQEGVKAFSWNLESVTN